MTSLGTSLGHGEHTLADILVAVALFGALHVALALGFRVGQRDAAADSQPSGTQVGAIQGAVLGLLGLLLAFTFAGAGSRFLERQDLIRDEANAIGTTYLRADLLAAPQRAELRTALQEYTAHRIDVVKRVRGLDGTIVADVERMHGRIWSAALAGVAERPETALLLLAPVNEVIDLHATRVAALDKRVPTLVMALLVASSLLALATIGYGCGLDGRRRSPLTLSLVLLVGCALWITIDLDHPRRGFLQLSDAPLRALKFDAP
jgi:hypothetical protein